jgi:2-oxo-3-hexenedioate decarboxylase
MPDTAAVALELDRARLERREVPPSSERAPFGLDDAYAIQRAGVALRTSRGERIVGWKMGLTSEAKRRQMNLDAPCYGVLTDAMRVEGTFAPGLGIHPKTEPEIAFVTSRVLHGRITRAEALASISAVMPALEILDSRYRGFKYFSLPDVVADNSSSAWFVLGAPLPPATETGGRAMRLLVDGVVAHEAGSDAISGHPLESLVQLCAMSPEPIPAGSVVLAGAATAAVAVEPGHEYALEVEGLGRVAFRAV